MRSENEIMRDNTQRHNLLVWRVTGNNDTVGINNSHTLVRHSLSSATSSAAPTRVNSCRLGGVSRLQPKTAVECRMASKRRWRGDGQPLNVAEDHLHEGISALLELTTTAARRKPTTSTIHKTGTGVSDRGSATTPNSVEWDVDELIPKASVSFHPLSPAPSRNPHSRPLETILRLSAAEFFNHGN